MKPLIAATLIILLFTSAASASIFSRADNFVDETRLQMGTLVEIKVPLRPGYDRSKIESAVGKAFDEIDRVEGVFSIFRPDSEISKINRLKKGRTLKISGETFGLIEKVIAFNKITKGAFDITVKPLVDLWGFNSGKKRVPSAAEIKAALEKTGSRYIILDKAKSTIAFAKDGMALDFNGIAKGYATDRAVRILKENGIKDAIVNSGGDMYCLGRRSKKSLWKVGIQHPRRKGELFLEMRLENKAAVTSGDYEKYFILDGRRYSHIIDPSTGYPIAGNTVSSTVIADDAATADALATSLCVLGEQGLKIVESLKNCDAIIIVKDKKMLRAEMTKAFKTGYYVIERKAFKERKDRGSDVGRR